MRSCYAFCIIPVKTSVPGKLQREYVVYYTRAESTSADGGTAVIKLSNACYSAVNGGNPGKITKYQL